MHVVCDVVHLELCTSYFEFRILHFKPRIFTLYYIVHMYDIIQKWKYSRVEKLKSLKAREWKSAKVQYLESAKVKSKEVQECVFGVFLRL